MKRLAIILAAFWTAQVYAAPAGEPGETAVAFLDVLRVGAVAPEDLVGQTMISPFCGKSKRAEIVERMTRMGRKLRRGGYELAAMEEKEDGRVAAVLVSAVSELDPLDVEVVAVGVGKIDGKWKVAPVAGSFENSHLGFDEALLKRVDELALWMGRERVVRLRDLQAETERMFQEGMAKALPGLNLKEAKPQDVVQALVKSCLKRDLPAVMALLGKLRGERTEEDRELLRIVSRGLHGLDRRNYWRLMTSPDVVRVLIEEDGGDDLDAEVVMLLHDPGDGTSAKLLRFILLRADGRWEVELPSSLLLADAKDAQFQQAVWREHDPDDRDLQKKFPEFFEHSAEPLRAGTLDEAGEKIEKILQEGLLEDLFRMLYRSEDITAGERRIAYTELGQFWKTFRKGSKDAADGDLVEVMQNGKAGVLVYHPVVSTQLDRGKLMPLVLIETDDGWSIAPGVTTAGNFKACPPELRKAEDEALEKFIIQKNELAEKAVAEFLKRFVEARPKEGAKVESEQASKLVKDFRQRLRTGKLLDSLEQCALLDPSEGAWEALEALNYEYRGAKHGKTPDRELGVTADGPWAAVSLRVDSGPAGVPDYLMYLIVSTESGPRIVADAGLRLAQNKVRKELNRQVWKRIENEVDAEEAGLVRKLFEAHVERSKTDLEEWEKNSKSSP